MQLRIAGLVIIKVFKFAGGKFSGNNMRTKLSILKWNIEYDKEITENIYSDYMYDCKCAYCRNFLATYNSMPADYFELLNILGIDPSKPANIIEYTKNNDGTHLYEWWFHIAGSLISKCDTLTKLNKQIDIIITDNNDLVATAFPDSGIQINFWSNLPWVLEEEIL